MLRAYLPPEQCSKTRGPAERLLVHCQVSAPAFAQRPFPFELEKSMRQQPLSAEDPILAKGHSDTQNSYTECAKLTYNLHPSFSSENSGIPEKFTTLMFRSH